MADATEQLTGLLPTIVVSGVAMKMTQSMFGSPTASRRGRKGKKSTYRAPAGISKKYSPW